VQHVRRLAAIAAFVPVIALAACGGSTARGSASASAGEHVQVTLTDFQIAPAQVVVHGDLVVFEAANHGQTPHNLTIRNGSGAIVGHTRDLNPGQSATMTLQLAPGTYTTYCALAGHESLGMRGTVTVGG
jgi:plastocyanin